MSGLALIIILAEFFAIVLLVLRLQNQKRINKINRKVYEEDLERRDGRLRAHVPYGETL